MNLLISFLSFKMVLQPMYNFEWSLQLRSSYIFRNIITILWVPLNGQEVLKIKILELAKRKKKNVGAELWSKNILSSSECFFFFFLVDNLIVGGGGFELWTSLKKILRSTNWTTWLLLIEYIFSWTCFSNGFFFFLGLKIKLNKKTHIYVFGPSLFVFFFLFFYLILFLCVQII